MLEEIEQQVESIRQCAGDYEGAHAMEDKLYKRVLRAIADGEVPAHQAAEAARAALKAEAIEFPRYCA